MEKSRNISDYEVLDMFLLQEGVQRALLWRAGSMIRILEEGEDFIFSLHFVIYHHIFCELHKI